ncbi:7734_t:CDS:10 [Entrophospora sp. SA101]|nr:7734_t:CDS:10 [Entrophospora sp. SA101]
MIKEKERQKCQKYYYNLKFEGFEDYLDKNNLTLISILRFRSIKQDFTYNKSAEHALISKFLSYIAQISKDEKWIMVANKLKKDGMLDQTQNEEVKRFWLDVEIERGEFQMKQTEIQFIVDRSISNNKTHDLIEEQNLNFISNYEMQTLNSGEFIKTTKTISEDTNTYSEEDGENDLEVIEHVGENLTEKSSRKRKNSKKTHMDSLLLNGIIEVSDKKIYFLIQSKFDKEEFNWLNGVLRKQEWQNQTKEFKEYINEKYCKRAWVPTLVRKSFIDGRFDPYYNEGYNIAQQIMTHCSVRLEAPVSNESNYGNLERTYSIDTIHKFDGIVKVIKTKKKTNKAIVLIEFSKGKKATEKKGDDHMKLCRNAMRILNNLLKTVSKEIARVYIIQPLPSIYLLNQFLSIKIPVSFDDFEIFATNMVELMCFQSEVLSTVRKMNKINRHLNDASYIKVNTVQCSPEKSTKDYLKNSQDPQSPTPADGLSYLPCFE